MTDIKDALAALSEAATDADREAAAVLYDALFPHNDLRATNIRLGNIDDGTAVQAFAAHRRNVITEAIRTGQLVPVLSVERVHTALTEAREQILDLANARWSECEATDQELVGHIDDVLAIIAAMKDGQ